MNQGYLKLMVMQQLLEKPCSGYTLVKNIQDKTGWKPSFGSMYPLLNHLEHDGVLNVHVEERKKVYSLTPHGKKVIHSYKETKEAATKQIIEQLKILHSLGHEEVASVIALLEQSKGEPPFKSIPESMTLRQEMVRLIKEGKEKTHQRQLRTIFAKTVNELKKI